MRIKVALLILAIGLLSISACAQSPDCFREEVFCAALVTDTNGLHDYGIAQDTWAGLERSKSDGVIDHIAHIESVDSRDYEINIVFFVNAGYDIIVTSGIGIRDGTLRSAGLYPDSIFIGMNQPGEESLPNFIPITFAEDQMGYLAGTLAARLTTTKTIGAVCETSGIDSQWRYCEGFRAGALSADNSVQSIILYRDDGDREKLFVDEEWGFENGLNLIQRGADVIFATGGGTGVGALRAATEAEVHAIGTERDQAAALGPGKGSQVITSIYGLASFEIQELMRSVKSGNISRRASSQIRYIPLDHETFSKDLANELDELIAGLLSGEIKTHVLPEKP